MHKFIDLKIDYAFKQLFGNEQNKKITIVFLNAMRTQKGEIINIEMQLSNQNDMVKRTLFYWSRLYTAQLQKGRGYRKLLPTITINICNFTVFGKLHPYHNTFHLYEDTMLERLNPKDDVLEIHFIEMNKFLKVWHDDQLNPLEDILARWLLLLGMVDARKTKVYEEIYMDLEELAMKDENFQEAFNVWESMSQTPETVIAYQSRLKVLNDEEARLADMREIGIEEGIEKGIKQGIEKGIEKGKKKKRKD
ncbi:MAG: Rpn family recombination-promoting nuclease/putative transposase [Solibacillus sp.]